MARTPFKKSIVVDGYRALVGRVKYGLGAKAPETPFFKTPKAVLSSLRKIDCSGLFRLFTFRSSDGKSKVPDGSQVQLAYFEKQAADPSSGVRKVDYRDAARYMTSKRVFVAFIKPFTNGCGKVGHVWFLVMIDGKVVTIESRGGKGVDSRPWDTDVLLKQVFVCFELPVASE